MKINTGKTGKVSDFTGAMTDISFLLIIFFLVSAVFMSTAGIVLKLPEKNSSPRTMTADEVVIVDILAEDEFLVNKQPAAGKKLLSQLISEAAEPISDPVMILNVDSDVKYQSIVDIMEITKESGISKFTIRYLEGEPIGLKVGEAAE